MGMDGNGWEWMGMDGNGWEWMGMDGNGWEWMGMDGNGWEWMGMDGNGMIIDSDYGSLPHSLLSTSKLFVSCHLPLTQGIDIIQ